MPAKIIDSIYKIPGQPTVVAEDTPTPRAQGVTQRAGFESAQTEDTTLAPFFQGKTASGEVPTTESQQQALAELQQTLSIAMRCGDNLDVWRERKENGAF